MRRIRDGVCEPIPPSEFIAWTQATGNIVRFREYEILRAMDRVHCEEMNKELADYRVRERERMQQEAEAARNKGRR